MKKNKIIYWISTGIIAFMMLFSAYSYLTNNEMKAALEQHLGYPFHFRIELAIAKVIGVLVLLIPGIPAKIKEWAYAGFTFVFISAFVAHLSAGDGIQHAIMPVIFLGILAASYINKDKIHS
ncbi:DoxX-like family protein [Chitinophaga sp. CF118]|uniref:DoxX family protein n=1 Tax=Chitinophaga sp. CF118 TaxID=1884367 RepID=UPI0008E2C2E4|nr:DoxX family protein [Chitinophaga sp. CF118]SFF00886.1 DoxX-like family protein [Chitinophaga sp. CF118]